MIGPEFGSGGSLAAQNVLGFSADELTVVTGGPDSTARFWRVPAAASASDQDSASRRSIWPPAGDAAAVATPDASKIIVGDRDGNVHVLAVDDGPESFLATDEIVSFLGHSGKIRLLSVSSNGDKVVSVASDNSIRVWNTATGVPQPFFGDVSGSPVERIVFSPDASMLGVLSGNRVQIMDAVNGSVMALFDLAEQHRSMSFADNDRLFVGSENGALRVASRETEDSWNLQTLWQGDAAIRWLEASPRSRYLTFVDQNNLAQQFILGEGRLGELSLQLPGRVEEVTYAPSGSRVLLRTAGWIHRASSAASGLIWLDAVLAPRPIHGSRMVFGNMNNQTANPLGNRVFVPVSGDGSVQLTELSFDGSGRAALFGNKEELLAEWRLRLGLD
jgi:WD40 repeat protein